MAEENNLSRAPEGFGRDMRYRGPRDRGGWNEGAPWNRRPARRDMDIVDKELNRYQPAFDHVQRYPEGYGGQPVRGGGRGGGGGGWNDDKFDRFINAIEGIAGKGGGNITNTFNPTFNPTNVNAGRDIRDTSIIGGGPNTAGRDITGAGGDVETGDGGGGNTVTGGPSTTVTNPGGETTDPPGGTIDPPDGTDEPPYEIPPITCPTPDMQILLSDKSQKPAGELQVGDEVRTAHEKDFTIGNYKVTRVEIVDSPIVKVNFEGKSITCSPSHKFYSETDDDWTSAENLKENDRVSLEDGEITFVSRQQMPDGKVVSITVDDAHTYICEGFLSHNKTLIPPDDENKYDNFINKTYNELLGRDAEEEGLTYWSKDLESGQTKQQVIDNIKRSDEYLNRQKAINLASSMEGKTYGVPGNRNADASLGNINEASLDAWIGKGGALTQSSDADAAGYYEGVGDKEKASVLLNSFSKDLPEGMVGLPAFRPLDDRQEAIYDMYTNVFGRNPDKEGLEYWTGAGGEGMSLADIEASFRGSAEAKLRDTVSGTDKPIYQSVDDYLAGKTNPPADTDGVPMGSNNASTGQSAPQSLAGDTDPAMLGQITKQMGLDPKPQPMDTRIGALPRNIVKRDIEDRVALMYKDLLGREADPEGLNYWTQEILNNPNKADFYDGVGPQSYQKAIEAAQDNIMRSDEYQQKKGRTSPPGEREPKPQPPIVGPLPHPPAPPKEPEIVRPKPPGPGRPDEIIPIMPTPGPSPEPVSPKVDNWLQDFYTQAGINKGVLDEGAKSYWEAEAAKVGKDKAKEIILGTAKAQNNIFPIR
tara:strand:- start:565 stop:3009 length:2445 start_codon:yes stop_codon:yes gene_type:complete